MDDNDERATKVNEQVSAAREICAGNTQGELIEGLVSVTCHVQGASLHCGVPIERFVSWALSAE